MVRFFTRATHRPHSAGGVGDNPERRSGQKKPSRSSMAEKYHGPTTFQTPLKPLKDSLPHSPFKKCREQERSETMVGGWLAGWLDFRDGVIREHMDRKASDSLV